MRKNDRASKAAAHKKRIEDLHKQLMDGKINRNENQSPAFQLYIYDFLIGTMQLSLKAIGSYIIILCYLWDKGFLPNDREAICKIGKCDEEVLNEYFMKLKLCKDGKYRNSRLEKIRAEQMANKERASEAGSTGNEIRWNDKDDADISVPEIKKEILPKPEVAGADFFYLGTEMHRIPVSKFMRDHMEIFLESWRMKNQSQNMDAVLAEMDKQKVGYPYTNEGHIQNTFSKIAREMLREKPKTESNNAPVKASTNYGRKK